MASYFWVGGSGTWDNSSTANWSASSGGAAGSGPPTNADTVNFDANSGTSATVTVTATAVSLSATVNKSDINLSLSGSPTLCTTAGTLTLTAGTITLNTYTLTVGTLSSSNSNARTIAFGTGKITATANSSTAITFATAINLSLTGTVILETTNTTATGLNLGNVNPGYWTESTVLPLVIGSSAGTAGIYVTNTTTLTLVGNYGNIDLTGFTGTLTNSTRTIYGNLTVASGGTYAAGSFATTFAATSGTKTITTNGKTLGFPITFDGVGGTWQLQDAMTVGSTRTTTLTNGTLDLSAGAGKTLTTGVFLSSNTNTRTIAFGSGNITVNGTGTTWTTSTVTNLTVTGTPVVNVSNNSATTTTINSGALSEANSISFNFTTGTYSLSFLASAFYTAKNVDFTGFAGTLFGIGTCTVYGNLTLVSGMTLNASSSAMTFAATSGTKTITTASKTLDFPITFNGAGGTFKFIDNFTIGSSRTMTLTNGTMDLNGNTVNAGTSFVTNAGTKNLTFNGGTLVCPAASSTAFYNLAPTNFTTTAGTGTGKISMTAATAKTFVGNGSTYNCTLSNDGAGALTITGSNTFTTIANGVQPTTFTFTAGTTTTVTNFSVSGTAGNLVTIGSVTNSSHTLSKSSGTVSCDYLSISRSTATGGASWYAGANSTNGGNNSGWLFSNAPANKGNMLLLF